jgi:pimeloyl-ACP methyl ester carboxylesterase
LTTVFVSDPDAESELRTMSLPDGRTLAWAEFGDRGGAPVIAFHGTPSSHLEEVAFDSSASERHIRVIAPDRPGIGRSSAQPRRVLLDWPADVTALADHLELDNYAVLGVSGGGPYALACGIDPDPRLTRAVVVSGCCPLDRPDANVGIAASDRLLGSLATHFAPGGRVAMRLLEASVRRMPGAVWRAYASELAPDERAIVEVLPERERFDTLLEATRQGPTGLVDDYRVTCEPWGFLPEEVEVPVTLWHGEADETVPLHQAQDLMARIPRVELHVVSGQGHLLMATRTAEILADLARGRVS